MSMFMYEIVKEYKMWVDGLGYTVHGRVLKALDGDSSYRFTYEVSHHYKPSKGAASAYYPSSTLGKTAKDAEALMMLYLRGFKKIGVVKNKKF